MVLGSRAELPGWLGGATVGLGAWGSQSEGTEPELLGGRPTWVTLLSLGPHLHNGSNDNHLLGSAGEGSEHL